MDVDLVGVAEVRDELRAEVGVVVDDEETFLGALSQDHSSDRFVECIGRRGRPLERRRTQGAGARGLGRGVDRGRSVVRLPRESQEVWRRPAMTLTAPGGGRRGEVRDTVR